MIDNFSGHQDSGLAEAMEKWKEEREGVARERARREIYAIICAVGSTAMIAWFDLRLAVAVVLSAGFSYFHRR
jgi:hypothetical protein